MRVARLWIVSTLVAFLTLLTPSFASAASGRPDCGVRTDAAAAAAEPTNVWLIGDSTMANPSSGTTCPVGWGTEFDGLFHSNIVTYTLAIGGRSIQTWLYEGN